MELTHFDAQGRARMVNVADKNQTKRLAIARGAVEMKADTLERVQKGQMAKGDVLGVARVAGIMAAKKTGELIPMCHPLLLDSVEVDFNINEQELKVEIEARVVTTGKTGVEMEALTAVSVAGLTIYDMCKAIDREMTVRAIRLVEKSGGKSGKFSREGEMSWQK